MLMVPEGASHHNHLIYPFRQFRIHRSASAILLDANGNDCHFLSGNPCEITAALLVPPRAVSGAPVRNVPSRFPVHMDGKPSPSRKPMGSPAPLKTGAEY